VLNESFDPGKCTRVNGRWLAVAGSRKNEIDVVVRSNSFLETEELKEVEYPTGRGYPFLWVDPAVIVSGGTGLGAAVRILEQRLEAGLKTSMVHYSRGLNVDLAAKAFPVLRELRDVVFWDTAHKGHPKNPLDPVSPEKNCNVFFAGPKSLFEALKKDPRRPEVYLNF
jgi:NAD(P)H-flavin reductase